MKTEFKSLSPQLILSRRELEVITLLAKGKTDKEIASELNLALGTVKNHHHHIRQKTGLRKIVALIHYALLHGLH